MKRSLAERFPNNREAYTDGKSEFVNADERVETLCAPAKNLNLLQELRAQAIGFDFEVVRRLKIEPKAR